MLGAKDNLFQKVDFKDLAPRTYAHNHCHMQVLEVRVGALYLVALKQMTPLDFQIIYTLKFLATERYRIGSKKVPNAFINVNCLVWVQWRGVVSLMALAFDFVSSRSKR